MSEPTRTHPPDPDSPTRTSGGDAGAATAAALPSPPGYELLGEIGAGGMGMVFRARDLDLGRDVAVKVLLPRYAPDSPTARRFLDEARITGRLQHPGIPAIYRVGTYADGRPFLAMKLIAGDTLEQLLNKRTDPGAGSGAAPDFGYAATAMLDRLAAFLESGRFLAIFEHVAQAVAYAHEQGIIHRDLKPANIMVGAFGEVQVMDWGIARSSDRRPDLADNPDGMPSATIEYAPPGDNRTPQSDLTQAGAILGTPAFMPPEQAIGAVDQIGKHSDVFGLGAILCVILTGKPPYAGADAESNRQLAARAKLDDAFARLDASGAEPELISLAKRCLAAEPAQRPAHAGEVWEAVAGLRADAERRARQAEMDRARAEVKSAEERKRRRVQRALALVVIGLLAVVGYTARRIDNEQARRRADQLADDRRIEEERKEREAERKTRQLAYERDVEAALNEVQILRSEGWKQADDPARWVLVLDSAALAFKRAEKLFWTGHAPDAPASLNNEFHTLRKGLEQDKRDRQLIAELDRIADANEVRLLIQLEFTSVTARQYAAGFRNHGIDLLAAPTAEAVAWLKGHRLRHRLVTAIRNWQQSLPSFDIQSVAEISLLSAVETSAAVAGYPAIAALGRDPNQLLEKILRRDGTHARLTAILKAVTDDPFARQWWNAVERKDTATLKKLVESPELRRMSARELASLADGLNPLLDKKEVLTPFLDIAHERFPGEFWVHFRLAFLAPYDSRETEEKKEKRWETTYRHLTAALAIRPKSAIARAALGIEMVERRKDVAEGLRLLKSAAEADPTSPWPHLFLGLFAAEKRDWTEGFRAMKNAVHADPDIGFFMTSAMDIVFFRAVDEPNGPTRVDIIRTLDELIAFHPKHPGGYDLLGKFQMQMGDHRAALALYRKAQELSTPDYPGRMVVEMVLKDLEGEARWEAKLPAVLRGELKPANSSEVAVLASYCATFEKRFALATRIAAEGIKADPKLLDNWGVVTRFAGWAVQAATVNGADAADHSDAERAEFRRLALEWMKLLVVRVKVDFGVMIAHVTNTNRDFAPVRDQEMLAKIPAAERAEWEKLWADVAQKIENQKTKSKPREVAPPPRALSGG